ncbi:Heterokaryon incompatibility protein [Rutstroemia sp. NJR-2017a BVV2]|nr:Heterokaryon incompatibility protein [Rutstroemia sp. NJR-2017a BVV2]
MAPPWYLALAKLRQPVFRSTASTWNLSQASRSIRTRSVLRKPLSAAGNVQSGASRKRTFLYILLGGALVGLTGFAAPSHIRHYLDGPNYKYQCLEKPDEIRVLVLEPGEGTDPLRCHVKIVSLSSNPYYEALSYVWGDPTITKPILCSGKNIRITTNLYDALLRFRLPGCERVLWADAICINQADVFENNTQVPLMKHIYSKAAVVLIWLGTGSKDTDRALDTLAQLHSYFSKHLAHYSIDIKKYLALQSSIERGHDVRLTSLDRKRTEEIRHFDWNAIASFLSLPWFTRAWTLQEYVKAPRAVLVCGTKTMTFHQFSKPLIEIFTQYIGMGRSNELRIGVTFPIETIWSIRQMSMLQASSSKESETKTLLELVKQHNVRACTDPKDKIYGFLGLANDLESGDWPLYPKYNIPTEDVYKQFTQWCIAKSSNLDVFASIRDYKIHSKHGSLPSWTPDWMDHGGRRDTSLAPVTTYAAGKASTAQVTLSTHDDNVLFVKGFVVDKVERLAISYYQFTLWDDYRHLRYPELLQSGVDRSTRAQMVSTFLSENVALQYLDGLVAAHEAVQKYSSPNSCPAVLRDIVWVENCIDVATAGTGRMSEERYEIFWRTIANNTGVIRVGDRVVVHSPASRSFKWIFKKHLKLLEDLRDGRRTLQYGMAPHQTGYHYFGALEERRLLPGTYLHEDEYNRWREVHSTWVVNRRRRFCSTVNGNLGWAPAAAKEGDLICIFHGAKTPHVLRPCGDGKYNLLGDGYLHGMMYGEVLKMKLKEEKFALY